MKSLEYWSPEKFEIASYKYNLIERKNKKYHVSGSDQTGLCEYSYNELGFRGDPINKNGFKVMSIGCSMVEGVGVNNNETWSFNFCELINNGVNMNMGCGGRSNDFIARCLLSYYDLIKPDLVLIMYTETNRKEFFTKDGGIEPFHNIPWGYFLCENDGQEEYEALIKISNKENDFQNWFKNHTLIKLFLENKKCNFLWNGWFATTDYSDEFRFDGDFSNFIDYSVEGKHPGPLTHKKYANDLYKYIIDNFPHYLD